MTTSLVGTVPPTAADGTEGDFYINTSTDRLYGPKGASIWPPYSLKLPIDIPTSAVVILANQSPGGGDGANDDYYIDVSNNIAYGPKTSGSWDSGTTYTVDFNTIRYGTTPPNNTLGIAGDFYIDLTTSMLYGPKTSTWPVGISLIGPAGEDGEDGDQGPDGEQGEQGPPGTTLFLNTLENKLIYGTSDPSDLLGRDGDVYLNTSTQKFFGPKTNGSWRNSRNSSISSRYSIPFWLKTVIGLVILLILIGIGVYVYRKVFKRK